MRQCVCFGETFLLHIKGFYCISIEWKRVLNFFKQIRLISWLLMPWLLVYRCQEIMENAIFSHIYSFQKGLLWLTILPHRYRPEVMGDGVINQNNNPEVDVDVMKPNFVIQQQLLQLRLITNKLRNAYKGLDVDWIDTGELTLLSLGKVMVDLTHCGPVMPYGVMVLGWLIKANTKWPPFFRRHFQMLFLEWKCLNFD